MNINSPTAIPSSLHEGMKEKQCTFWYLFLLKHTAGILVWESGTQGPLIAWFTN